MDQGKFRGWTVLLLLFAAPAAHAAHKGYWSIQLENDVIPKAGDHYYTHGTEIGYLKLVPPEHWLIDVADAVPFFQRGYMDNAVNYTVGQKIFTPDNTEAFDVVEDDRPYAGYLYYNVTLLSRIEQNQYYDSGNMLGLSVGIVGPSSGAEQVQEWYHDMLSQKSPNGWDNQLRDELTLGVSYTRVWSIVIPATSHFEFGVSPHITGVVGSAYTYAAGGVMFRFGTYLKGELAPPNIGPGFPGASFFDVDQKFNWYLFAGHESRVVGRNIFLDGNSYADSHSVDREVLVGDHQFGIAFHISNVRIAISNMIRTKEYTTQEEQTQYGALNISFAM